MVAAAVSRAVQSAVAVAEAAVVPWQRLRDPGDRGQFRGLTVAAALTLPVAERFTAWVLDAPDLSTAATARLFRLAAEILARTAAVSLAAVAGADAAQTVTELQQVPPEQLPPGGIAAVLPARLQAPLAHVVAASAGRRLLAHTHIAPADWAALAGLCGRAELAALEAHLSAVRDAQRQVRAANAAAGGALSDEELAANLPPLGPPPQRALPWLRFCAVALLLHEDLNLRVVRALAKDGVLWSLTSAEVADLLAALFEASPQRDACLADLERIARGEDVM